MLRPTVLVSSLILLSAAATDARASNDLLLCVTDAGFTGDTTLNGYTGCSDATSIGEIGFIDGTTPIARDIKLIKNVDSMSNALRRALVNGTTISQLYIRAVVIGASVVEPQTLRLLGARVTADSTSFAVTDVQATETVTFMPARIEFTFHTYNGVSLGPVSYTCWDVVGQSATAAACQ